MASSVNKKSKINWKLKYHGIIYLLTRLNYFLQRSRNYWTYDEVTYIIFNNAKKNRNCFPAPATWKTSHLKVTFAHKLSALNLVEPRSKNNYSGSIFFLLILDKRTGFFVWHPHLRICLRKMRRNEASVLQFSSI